MKKDKDWNYRIQMVTLWRRGYLKIEDVAKHAGVHINTIKKWNKKNEEKQQLKLF